MKSLIQTLCLVGLLLLAAAAPASTEQDFAAAETPFHKALAGDSGSSDEAAARFESLAAAATPHAPLFQAYFGAAQTLQGRDAWMPWNKMRITERGLAAIDKALSRLTSAHDATLLRGAPLALETRLVAASTFLAVPDMFHRLDDAKAVLRAAFASPAFAAAPASMRAELYRQAALAAARDKKPQEEIEQLKKTVAAEPNGPAAAAARQRLQEIGS